jgi:hypothetical protein
MDFPPKTREEAGENPSPDGRSTGGPFSDQGLNNSTNRSPAPHRAGPVLVTAPPVPPPRGAIWVERAFLVVFVCFCVWIGMLLIVLPWTPAWTQNNLILHYPNLRAFLGQNFVRGLASGLGMVDVWVGIWEAVHYREDGAA